MTYKIYVTVITHLSCQSVTQPQTEHIIHCHSQPARMFTCIALRHKTIGKLRQFDQLAPLAGENESYIHKH